jgi:hypothetical protein
VNHAALLKSSTLNSVLKKPLLRSANTLEGIFHEVVIACEADSDCRFYEVVLRRMEERGEVKGPVDVYFAHGGGKGELATLAETYRALSVRVAIIADFDLLRRQAEFQKVLGALGAQFDEIASTYRSVSAALASLPPPLSAADVADKLRDIGGDVETKGKLTPEHRRAIESLIRDVGDWSEAKKYGLRKLRGSARRDAEKLFGWCAEKALFLVPFGELEGWWDAGSPDKNEWIIDALRQIASDPASFKKASQFLGLICGHFGFRVPLDIDSLLQ